MTIITKGMGAIIKGIGKGKGKGIGKGIGIGIGKGVGKKAVPKAVPRPKKFRLTKTDDAFVAGAGIGTAVTSEIHREKNRTPSPHRTRKSIGGVLKGIGKVLKGPANKFRMDQAQRLKDYHRKTKIQKRKAGRIEEGKSKAFHKKYINPLSPETKAAYSKGQHPKSWRRAGKGLGGILKGAKEVAKKVFKKKPKPSKENQWKGESVFDWVDRKDAEDAIAGGWPPPKIKPGKIAKNIVKAGKVGVAAIPASYAYGKWQRHKRAKKKKDKEKD